MTFSELDEQIKKENALKTDADFLAEAKRIISEGTPKMQKMKNRLKIEGLATAAVLAICGLFYRVLPFQSVWMTLTIAMYTALYFALELLAFRFYWYSPQGANIIESMRKFSVRMNAVAYPMKVLRIGVALFIVLLLFIDGNFIHFLELETTVLLLFVSVATSMLSRRWISYAKNARVQLADFEGSNETN